MSIIERDIEFYTGEVERAEDALHRCVPEKEPTYRSRRDAARDVVEALKQYQGHL